MAAFLSQTPVRRLGLPFDTKSGKLFITAVIPPKPSARMCLWRRRQFASMDLDTSSVPLNATNLCSSSNIISGEVDKDKFLIDCGPDQECVLGGIVALGKFDALHVGHRELAVQASKIGTPFLLSFVGMAEVLGWVQRAPIVAKCDRKRVLSSWAPLCGNVVPLEYNVEFSSVRHLSPRQFVERLVKELGVSGVVAGENYRFGYKAAGDASDLVHLCDEYGITAYIVNFVMDNLYLSNGVVGDDSVKDQGQVSSSRVRKALAAGDVDHVTELLGRNHRLLVANDCVQLHARCSLSLPLSSLLNQPPKEGSYGNCSFFADDLVVEGSVVIDDKCIHLELQSDDPSTWNRFRKSSIISIEFNGSGYGAG